MTTCNVRKNVFLVAVLAAASVSLVRSFSGPPAAAAGNAGTQLDSRTGDALGTAVAAKGAASVTLGEVADRDFSQATARPTETK